MEQKNIQYISDSYLCSNCGACAAICNLDAISFNWTSMGRLYAQIDAEKCINCGRCKKVCPSIVEPSSEEYPDRYVGIIKNSYVGRATDEAIFKNAQSGGVCTAILKYLFDSKKIDCAVVCQMESGCPTPEINARIITEKCKLVNSQKSCYTPIEMLSVLKQTSSFRSVAFVGLPCHIEGLANLQKLNKQYHNITYKIGLICDRTMCRTVMDVFATYTKEKTIKIDWRRKYDEEIGYHYENAPVVVYSAKESKRIPNKHRFLMKEFFTPPRCRVCYDKLNIMADIVLGDPWRMPNVNICEGASVVISRTEKGQSILEEAIRENEISLTMHPSKEVITGQLIDERRESVSKFTSSLKAVCPKTNSYILNTSQCSGQIDHKITDFIKREEKSKDLVVQEALMQIKEMCTPPTLIIRVKCKLKSIINKMLYP